MMMSDDVIHLLRLERCVADVAHAVVVAWMDAGRYSCYCPRKPLCRDIRFPVLGMSLVCYWQWSIQIYIDPLHWERGLISMMDPVLQRYLLLLGQAEQAHVYSHAYVTLHARVVEVFLH